jgi:hypothetical protein
MSKATRDAKSAFPKVGACYEARGLAPSRATPPAMTRSRSDRSRFQVLKTWAPRLAACLGALGVCAASCIMATGATTTLDGCTDDDAESTLDDVTGIVIRSEALFAPVGCGTGSSEVYRYFGVVDDPSNGNNPIANGYAVYPCYADATFDLQNPSTNTYRVRVYAYDYASYQALGGTDDALLATLGVDTALRALSPSYTTTCSAQQQENIEVLAVCNPLVSLLDGGSVGDDGGDDDAADASDGGDGGDADAGLADSGSGDTGASDADAGDGGDASLADADAGDGSG